MRLLILDNQTGLSTQSYIKMGPGRIFYDVVAIKTSFHLSPDGIGKQTRDATFNLSDVYRNPRDPLGSSLEYTNDLILGKPGTDIYATGSVRAAHPRRYWPILIECKDAQTNAFMCQYECEVSGPRLWRHSLLGGWHLSDPELTDRVPIQYELAWGGRQKDKHRPIEEWHTHELNPSGSGFSFFGFSTSECHTGTQWAVPIGLTRAFRQRELVGLGPIPRFWASRKRYAGTYDVNWFKERHERQDRNEYPISDYPKDFDPRFFHAAHPSLQTRDPLKGNEHFRLVGLLPFDKPVDTRLPGWKIMATIGQRTTQLPIDSIHFDLDACRANVMWRLTIPHVVNVSRVVLNLVRKTAKVS